MIKLTKEIKFKEYSFWITSTRKLGISFYSHPLDIELLDTSSYEQILSQILKNSLDDVKFRIQHYAIDIEHSTPNHSRYESLKKLNESHSNVVFHFEKKISLNDIKNLDKDTHKKQILEKFLDQVPIQELSQVFNLENVEDVKPFFWDLEQPIVQSASHLDTGFEFISLLKLIKPASGFLSLNSLSQILLKLPKPFEIHLQTTKIPKALTQMKFAQSKKRDEQTNSVSGQTKSEVADQALAGIEFKNDAYYGFEWHLVLRRSDIAELKADLKEAFSILSSFAQMYIETIGNYPSFMSTQLGSDFHFKGIFEQITEKDEILPCYMPLLTYGARRKQRAELNDLAFHRIDGSIDYLNQFDPAYNNANINIIGQAGKGKSVFINRKILADSFDPETILIIVDVKGSHTRLVSSLNGDVMQVTLNQPSGINPVKFLKSNKDEKILEIVKTFLCELCLDDEEKKLSEVESSEIEEALIKYADSESDKTYSIDEFMTYLPDSFSRKKLLKRYSEKGLLKHVFSNLSDTKTIRNRIRYYNFQNIDTAANSAVSRAIMASIMADTSFTLATKRRDQKLMFISDETPFFIKNCFRSFSLLSKNVRSLYGSLMLTVQVSQDLMLDGDKSLIDNASSHVFLSRDESDHVFKERFNLSDFDMDKLNNLSGVQGKYSQFLIKDNLGSRIGNLFLTKKEYWQSTTKATEQALIDKMKSEFQNLDEDLILTLISENELRA